MFLVCLSVIISQTGVTTFFYTCKRPKEQHPLSVITIVQSNSVEISHHILKYGGQPFCTYPDCSKPGCNLGRRKSSERQCSSLQRVVAETAKDGRSSGSWQRNQCGSCNNLRGATENRTFAGEGREMVQLD